MSEDAASSFPAAETGCEESEENKESRSSEGNEAASSPDPDLQNEEYIEVVAGRLKRDCKPHPMQEPTKEDRSDK